MNLSFLIAGILCFVLGIVHSIFGEILIFSSKREKGAIVPAKKSPDLKAGHLRIIWATWHLASVLGGCLGAILLKISLQPIGLDSEVSKMVVQSTIFGMLAGCLLVLIGTKGKHPGWIVLLLIAILLLLGSL